MAIRIDLTSDPEVREFAEVILRIPQALEKSLPSLIGMAGEVYVRQLREHAPVSMPSPGREEVGELRDSIQAESVKVRGVVIEVDITSHTKADFTLPPGVKPHTIPTGGKMTQVGKGYPLRFFWDRVGDWVELWEVEHPGYQPEGDWVMEAAQAGASEMDAVLRRFDAEILLREV